MKQSLKEVGGTFRVQRKEMNLSLKEVENATSIRMTYLQAIEEGEVSRLISPVYAQGFVKQYATFLGLDGDKVVSDYPEVFNKQVDNQEFSYGIGTIEMRGNPGSGVKAVPNTVWVLAFVAVLAAAWTLAKFLEVF